jgi:hypothetical protein
MGSVPALRPPPTASATVRRGPSNSAIGALTGAQYTRYMRLVIAICAITVALYWVDQTYFYGGLSQQAGMMLRQIAGSYR